MYKGLGDPIDYMGASWCGDPPWSWFCSSQNQKAPLEQMITDTSDYGSQLTPESQQMAEELARQNITADMANNPCAYSEISGMSWIGKAQCNLGIKQPSAYLPWIIGGGLVLLLLRR